jgi:cytochrome c-type biogenesis protein CcmH
MSGAADALRRWLAAAGLTFAFVLAPAIGFAVEPSEMLADPGLEARAEAIGSSLRCLVCQNESIEASGADLAHDLRVLVRQRLQAGDTDQQVVDYIVSRYGEYVLLKPVLAPYTIILWFAAPALLLIGGVTLFVLARARGRAGLATAPMSPEEAAALERLDDDTGPAAG